MSKWSHLMLCNLALSPNSFHWNRLNFLLQARVVQRLDNAIHRINRYPADSVVCFVLLTFIPWIVIYPVDSVNLSSL